MQSFIFNSPSVKINENNNTNITSSVNAPILTPTGIVGEFPKGPAFEKILTKDKNSFIKKFGNISSEKLNNQPKYLGSYYGLSYLEEGNTLYTTRVLGLSGYDAGDAWVLTLKQPSGLTIDQNSIIRTTSTLINPYNSFIYYLSSSTLNINGNEYQNVTSATTRPNSFYSITPPLSSYTQNIINNKYYSTGISFNFINSNLKAKGLLTYIESVNTLTNSTYREYLEPIDPSYSFLAISTVNHNALLRSYDSSTFNDYYLLINNISINNNKNIDYSIVSDYNNFDLYGSFESATILDINGNFDLGVTVNGITGITSSNVLEESSCPYVNINNEEVLFNYDYILYFDGVPSQYNILGENILETTTNTYNNIEYFYDNNLTLSIPSLNSVYNISSGYTYIPSGYYNIDTYKNIGDAKTRYEFNNLSTLDNNVIIGNLSIYNYIYEANFIYETFINQVIGIIRGNKKYVNNSLINQVSNITFYVDDSINPLSMFTINVFSDNGNKTYRATLDYTSDNFIGKVIPKIITSGYDIYLDSLYVNLLNDNLSNNLFINKSPDLININTSVINKQHSNYLSTYKTPETPYIVSNLIGNNVKRLFKFVSISDGEAANSEIKISIENINFIDNSFTVLIRDFNDTDNNPIVLEQFDKCNLDSLSNNYVLRKIGGVFENDLNNFIFDINSSYVYLVMVNELPTNLVPSGFEGYTVRSYTNMLSPNLIYKNSYLDTDIINKTYLGLNKIDLDLMKFIGNIQTDETITKTKGFHFDSNADNSLFSIGIDSFNNTSVQNLNNKYNKLNTRKFTLTLAGGFDGWDIFRTSRTNTNNFKNVENSDYNAYLNGIKTFIDTNDSIDLLCTPNINFSDNNSLVQEIISLVENRDDCFYVIDSPYLPNSINLSNQIISLLETTDIDTSNAATYFGYIGVTEPNTKQNIFIPPTGEVLRVMTLTDKTTKPWFAPAGINRGIINNSNSLVRNFNLGERDILQLGRINPIISTDNYGINIFGQRTLLNGTTNNLLTKINVRRLLNYIKKELKNIALTCLFEQNNQTNVNTFLNKTRILLSNIQKQQGLNNYSITVDENLNTPENIDRGLMFFNLELYPISATEGIGITIGINSSESTIIFTI